MRTTRPLLKSSAWARRGEELGEAQAWIANDEPLFNSGKSLADARVSRLAELLEKVDEERALASGAEDSEAR